MIVDVIGFVFVSVIWFAIGWKFGSASGHSRGWKQGADFEKSKPRDLR